MMAAHGIPVSAQEMIIRRRKYRFVVEIVPNVLPETRRRPPDICQISPALHLRPPLFHILKNCCCCCCCCCYCCSCCYCRCCYSSSSTAAPAAPPAPPALAPAPVPAPAPAPAPCGTSTMRKQHHTAAAPRGSIAPYSSVSRLAHNREMHKSIIRVQGIFLI